MSMPSIGILNNQIMMQSVSANQKTEKKQVSVQTEAPKQHGSYRNMFIGATALAGVVIAGILVARGKKTPNIVGKPISLTPKEETYVSGMKLQFDPVARKTEDDLRYMISQFFVAFRDSKKPPLRKEFSSKINLYQPAKSDFNSYLDFRMKNVMFLSDKKIPADLRQMATEEVDAILYFIKNYDKVNIPLRNGENLPKNENITRLTNLINDAEPLNEDAYVLRGIRTRNLQGNFEKLDFDELDELEIGDTIIDKGFVSTARTYDTELASVDPLLLSEPLRNSGYIMRIKLPKGTKGFDCRRLTQFDSDKGINSTFILPPDSEFKITAWDAPRRILDCDYILPE